VWRRDLNNDHYYLYHNETRYELKQNHPYVFGRVKGDFCFSEDELISRRHAVIEWKGDKLILRDLASTNGTRLNDKGCKESVLSSGDKIEIGSQAFVFMCEKDEPVLSSSEQLGPPGGDGSETLFIEGKVRSLLDGLSDPRLKAKVEDIKSLYDNKRKRGSRPVPEPHSPQPASETLNDLLTGISNRQFFDSAIKNELERTKRYEGDLALLLVDIDHFKSFNETHGALKGDSVLQLVAQVLEHNCRDSDSVCRFSGAEFALILPETDCKHAFIVAEKLRAKVEELSAARIQLPVTVSIGVAGFDCLTMSSEDALISEADQLLHKAKDSGRNQVGISL